MTVGAAHRLHFRELPGGRTLGDLGFSLKPPKWIRKAQPGKFIKKHALAIGLIGGSLLIPGVAPLAARGLVGAGRLAGRGFVGAGRLVGKAGRGAF